MTAEANVQWRPVTRSLAYCKAIMPGWLCRKRDKGGLDGASDFIGGRRACDVRRPRLPSAPGNNEYLVYLSFPASWQEVVPQVAV